MVLITQLTTGGAVTAKVTATTPDDDCPWLTATIAHGKVRPVRSPSSLTSSHLGWLGKAELVQSRFRCCEHKQRRPRSMSEQGRR